MMKEKFLDLLLDSGVLRFGEFVTKSGRSSPYFFNTGHFDHGAVLTAVASCYADLIQETCGSSNLQPHLYGPAYKGIAIATSVAQELARRLSVDVPFTFNRKESKDHGEGGRFVGRPLSAKSSVIIVEDVMTGGTSVRETLDLLSPLNVQVSAVVLGVDRQERGLSKDLASTEISQVYNIPVYSILTISEIVERLWNRERLGKVWIDDSVKERIDQYRREFS